MPVILLVTGLITEIFYYKKTNPTMGSALFFFIYIINNFIVWFWGVFDYSKTAAIIIGSIYIIIIGLAKYTAEKYIVSKNG